MFYRSLLSISLLSGLYFNTCHSFVKELGIGDNGVAYPQSASTARYNPAGISDIGNQVDGAVGSLYFNGRAEVKDSALSFLNQKGSTTQCKWFPAGIFGISKAITQNITVAFSTDAGITSAKGTITGGFNAFGTGKLGAESVVAVLIPTIAYRWRCHSFGFSPSLNISRIKVNGFQNFEAASLYPNDVTNKGYDWAQALNLRFGWLWHATDSLAIGASYYTQDLCGSHFKKYKGLIPLHGKFEVPPEARFGAAYHFCKSTIAFQFVFFNFKNSKTTGNPVNASGLLGSSNGPGGGFKNVLSFNIGADYQFDETLKLRAGYIHVIAPFALNSNVANSFIRPTLFPQNSFLCGLTKEFCKFYIDWGFSLGFKRSARSDPLPQLANARISGEGLVILNLIGIGRHF